jgi:hypothetical protein
MRLACGLPAIGNIVVLACDRCVRRTSRASNLTTARGA